MSSDRPAPITVTISAVLIERLQRSASHLDLSVNSCCLAACRAISIYLKAGWRPIPRHSADSGSYLSLRFAPEVAVEFKQSAELAGLVFADFLRLAVVATLLALEGKDTVNWPLRFTLANLERAEKYSRY